MKLNKDATIDDLRAAAKAANHNADIHEAIAAGSRREAAEYEAEIEKLMLDDYWKANPHLIPLKVGDKLLVPEDDHCFNSGDVVEITRIRPNLVVHVENNSGDNYPFEMSEIVSWRKAYLESEATK